MILVNTDYVSGKELETLQLVKGSTIQSKHLGKDIAQAFKSMLGGELKAYNDMMNEARAIATKRMVAEAEEYYAAYPAEADSHCGPARGGECKLPCDAACVRNAVRREHDEEIDCPSYTRGRTVPAGRGTHFALRYGVYGSGCGTSADVGSAPRG